jgi:dimethylamine/trimethylamine dehydrogenase
MALSNRYDILFEPVTVGPKVAPNRFWQTPHACGFGSDLPGGQAAFRRMKAEGGWGVVFTEATSIAPEVDKSPAPLARLWDEGDVRNFTFVVDQIHRNGALAGIELEYHSSIGYLTEGRGLNARGVAPVAGQSGLPVGYAGTAAAIDLADIAEIQQLHVAAALRARDAGFDLITLHCGHAASLLAHFLISYYNNRTDEYGGSLENRARFARETLQQVRSALGDSAAVGLRFGVDTLDDLVGLGDRGIRADGEAPRFVEHMDDLVDYWDLVIGGFDWGQDAQSSRTAEENHEARYVGQMKKHTVKPVVNVGRFNSPDVMADIVRAGQCDFIGAARAGISDPFLPQKIRSDRTEDIRECIGCNICVSRDSGTGRIQCTQNATAGEEFRRGWHPEIFTRADNAENDVLVIGAGPAGMECALVLGRRGLRNVHLVDAAASLGGSLNWVTKVPGRAEWRRLIEYREVQLRKQANVQVILNTPMTVDDALGYGAGIVVTATGSCYGRDGLNPFNHRPFGLAQVYGTRLLTPEDILGRGAEVGRRVAIVDTDGYFIGPGLAELLAGNGHEVTVVTPAEALGHYTKLTLEYTRLAADLRALGVTIHTLSHASGASPDTLRITGLQGDTDIGVDTVILVGQRESQRSLYAGLTARRNEWLENGLNAVYQIGDSVRPHFIADAIFSGHRLAREIDSPNPAVPLPFIRERRLIGATDDDYRVGSYALSPLH